uniref:Uncharacterized protein n=1 Tax=Anguilla anguilla TaxID=7936 RepID=A0A0E9T448_ANGAN
MKAYDNESIEAEKQVYHSLKFRLNDKLVLQKSKIKDGYKSEIPQ